MITLLSDNIISPLGLTTEENLASVESGKSELRFDNGRWGISEPFVASLMPDDFPKLDGCTRWESILILSIREALEHTSLDVTSDRVVFVLSTTKGNIDLLENPSPGIFKERIYLGEAARHVTEYFGNHQMPIVVSNACTSGVCAQIVAKRLLEEGHYDYAIVAGAEVQSKFITSGFLSFKSVSTKECRPFDMERQGMNLGEAAATMIFSRFEDGVSAKWHLVNGAIHNDAFHISNPSKTGEGSYRCLMDVMSGNTSSGELAVINAHGTSTLFNDEMEAVAISRAGLADVPVNSLKGYFGHTMGAAGLLETIITIHSTSRNIILPTRGFEELGVSKNIDVVKEKRITGKNSFIKLISGFGGTNAAVKYVYGQVSETEAKLNIKETNALGYKTARVKIQPDAIILNECRIEVEGYGPNMLKNAYKIYIGDYPKFYKMDIMSKLGLLASEMLLRDERPERDDGRSVISDTQSNRDVIIFSRVGTINVDSKYFETIRRKDDYYPSPTLFVYTLPNIVAGEIAIRNGYHGETNFYALPSKDNHIMDAITMMTLLKSTTKSVISGWIDALDDRHFEADMELIISNEKNHNKHERRNKKNA